MGADGENLKNGNDKNGSTDIIARVDDKNGLSDEKKTLDEIKDADTIEGQVKKIPYPKSVAFIISNEFCERFNYYGMRTILVLYLSRELGYSDDTSTVIFHIFTMLVYFLCTFGAIIADSWLGKFRTILYLSIVYVFGSVMITLGAIPPLNLPGVTFTMIGLSLIALGSGGIKPCVAAFGGDQFKLPEQLKQVATFFSLFYFAINSGSLISTTVTPILREDVHCFGQNDCYSLAFGVPAILMAVSIVIFVLGKPLYKTKPPAGNMFVTVSKTIGCAISTRFNEKKTNPREHWLDYAECKYDKQSIADVKVLLRVLVLYIPLPIFWALFDQQGSRWTFQATRMDGDMGGFDIKPDQLQMLNPLLILVFIPLYDVAFYPLLSKIGIRRPLQKLTAGGVLAGIAFIISAIVEINLEKTYPVLPSNGYSQLRIFNGMPECDYTINTNIPGHETFTLKPMQEFEEKFINVAGGSVFDFTISTTSPGCPEGLQSQYDLGYNNAYTMFFRTIANRFDVLAFDDNVDKPSRGSPTVRTLANLRTPANIKWVEKKRGTVRYNQPHTSYNLTELSSTMYEVHIDNLKHFDVELRQGGSYAYLLAQTNVGYVSQLIHIAEPNSMSILWLIPQYVVITLGEVMFSVTGLEFSYSQAPVSMKSVLQACWLLAVAFGNVIVVIIAELKLFESQANEFFLFAGLMFVDMGAFMVLAYYYKPNNPQELLLMASTSDEGSDSENDSKPKALEFTPAIATGNGKPAANSGDFIDVPLTKAEPIAAPVVAALEAKSAPAEPSIALEKSYPPGMDAESEESAVLANGIDRPSPPTVTENEPKTEELLVVPEPAIAEVKTSNDSSEKL